ncbi:MAG: grasp-with-spasm system ATP-grasp peptide maturase [Crocinitomicaceae bacterium]
MILIISEEKDHSTSHVIEWINYFGKEFLRINDLSKIEKIEIDFQTKKFQFEYCSKMVKSDEVTGYWFRRSEYSKTTNHSNYENKIIIKEHQEIIHFLLLKLEKLNIPKIGSYFNSNISKLVQLEWANKSGLKTPKSYIKSINNLCKNKSYITKPLNQIMMKNDDGEHIVCYTNEISNLENYELTNSFIQEKIEKSVELRIFVLNKKVFPMAIISQKNSKTSVDFRRYDGEIPNRNIQYPIPKSLERKLITFCNYVGLNSGSFDIIKEPNGDFCFLEVNPVGQFGMVSKPCNYNLEFEIAQFLCS